jgi:hypothetical protein
MVNNRTPSGRSVLSFPVSFITTDKRARAVKRDNGNRGQSENHTDASAMPDTGGSRVSAISVARAAT